MTRLFHFTALVLLALTVLASCKSTSEQADASDTSGVPPAIITVHNSNVLDMTVYVQRNTQRIRLGMVTAGSEKTFTLSEDLIVNSPLLQFIADPIGSYEQDLHRRRGLAGWRFAGLYGAGRRYTTRAATGNRLPTGGAVPN